MHLDCYKQHILQHHNIDYFSVDHPNSVACTKAHHGHLLKQFAKVSNPISKRNVSQNKDSKFGLDDPNTPESIIIRWMAMSGNLERYRNGDESVSKEVHCREVY